MHGGALPALKVLLPHSSLPPPTRAMHHAPMHQRAGRHLCTQALVLHARAAGGREARRGAVAVVPHLHSSETMGLAGKRSGALMMFSKVSSRREPRKGVKPNTSS